MKTTQELLAGVRDCSVDAHLKYFDRTQTSLEKSEAFESGHRAACDRLIPPLVMALHMIETMETEYDDDVKYRHADKAREEIRALLERRGE